ncbi:uncharacterized protein LOC111262881 isoform X2 [Varroa jacobsoni]|uniref:uncharacterized protein LOC111262881 isoform X2 n=1 Tax=Varroa jacobsoni TaxID=62625 RepID=UPI000BF4A54E|nr:uncharacterized protein LOC111262881 isoform X2 [Varroa jacobsoni]
MGDVTKKAGGYVQVKLIPSDRSGQTWSGWARRWVDLLLVKKDSMKTKKETFIEAWIEVRKKKSSAKPIKMWTIDAKDTLVYRCTSRSKNHPFGIRFKDKDLLYLSGNSESESQEWMKRIRSTLWPVDKGVELETSAGKLFEVSVIDNNYSVSCELLGSYGHLTVRENKLMMFDYNGRYIVQEWYLHTIRKLDAFKASQIDTGRLLSVHLGENSSTGCGVLYLFCPSAVLLLETVQAKIKEIFSNLEDERKAQQATLLSLGALHDISLEEFEARDDDFATKTITISDEIIKAKNELTVGGIRGTPRPSNAAPMQQSAMKNEPWQDNCLYEGVERADYTPELDREREDGKKQRSQSLVVMTRPRTNSCTLELDLPDLTKLKKHLLKRRGSLPQRRTTDEIKSQMSLVTNARLRDSQTRQDLHRFRQVLNLSATRDIVRLDKSSSGSALGAVNEVEESSTDTDSPSTTPPSVQTTITESVTDIPKHLKENAASEFATASIENDGTSPSENTDFSNADKEGAFDRFTLDMQEEQPTPAKGADKAIEANSSKTFDATQDVAPADSDIRKENDDNNNVNMEKEKNIGRDNIQAVTINFGLVATGVPPPKPQRIIQYTRDTDGKKTTIIEDLM